MSLAETLYADLRGSGIDVQLITRRDYPSLPEFDALFIRETTAIDHHTYRFARKAEAEGMVVIDDPESILRCTNKVFLAELLTAHGLPTPPTRIIAGRRDVADAATALGYPLVLKIPDGSFSRGVKKADDRVALERLAAEMLEDSDLILAQAFMPTTFDWRVGVLGRHDGHGHVEDRGDGGAAEETLVALVLRVGHHGDAGPQKLRPGGGDGEVPAALHLEAQVVEEVRRAERTRRVEGGKPDE